MDAREVEPVEVGPARPIAGRDEQSIEGEARAGPGDPVLENDPPRSREELDGAGVDERVDAALVLQSLGGEQLEIFEVGDLPADVVGEPADAVGDPRTRLDHRDVEPGVEALRARRRSHAGGIASDDERCAPRSWARPIVLRPRLRAPRGRLSTAARSPIASMRLTERAAARPSSRTVTMGRIGAPGALPTTPRGW